MFDPVFSGVYPVGIPLAHGSDYTDPTINKRVVCSIGVEHKGLRVELTSSRSNGPIFKELEKSGTRELIMARCMHIYKRIWQEIAEYQGSEGLPGYSDPSTLKSKKQETVNQTLFRERYKDSQNSTVEAAGIFMVPIYSFQSISMSARAGGT